MQNPIKVQDEGIQVNYLFGLKEKCIKWEDIDLVNAVQMYPAVPLKLEIIYHQHSKCFWLFEVMPIWNEALTALCERLPSFSIAAIEEAREDIYEQLRLCWKRE